MKNRQNSGSKTNPNEPVFDRLSRQGGAQNRQTNPTNPRNEPDNPRRINRFLDIDFGVQPAFQRPVHILHTLLWGWLRFQTLYVNRRSVTGKGGAFEALLFPNPPRLTNLGQKCRLTIFALVGVAVLMAAPIYGLEDRSIEGQVRVTTGGSLPSGIVVKLEVAENVVVAQQLVGETGKFEFHNLKDQQYRIIVTAEGYQPANVQVDMAYYATRFPTVYLTPLGAKKSPPPPSASTTDLAAPKKARKEYEEGHDALQAKDLASARKHFETAVETDPCYARALTELGVVLTLQGEIPSAEDSFQKSIHCDGEFLEAYLQMAILLDTERKYPEGESILLEALRVAPSDWQPYYRLGAVHQHAGKYKEATEEYLKAESLSGAVPAEIHLRLADAYLQQKKYDQAYDEMQTYLRIAPDGPLANQTRSLLPQIDSMRKSNSQAATGPP
jgi:tetratricopeptide (TPR) repeat protein